MDETPEYFYKKIQGIQTKLNTDVENGTSDNYGTYLSDLEGYRSSIQSQINLIVTEKPVKSQQMLSDYKEIYDTNYMTNFSLFLGICLILWYILTANSKPNVPTPTATV